MGMTHSRSEDLYKRSVINSGTFTTSISETPGYFSRTFQTLDFIEQKFPQSSRQEMSYNGPPSHLQNSIDVHPFWSTYGREFLPTDRFNDMSSSNGGVPRGLLPGTDSAQEMRDLELKESLKDLRSQVKEKMSQVRPIPEERVASDDNSVPPVMAQGVDEVDSKKPLTHPQKGSTSPPSSKASSLPTAAEQPVTGPQADGNIDNEEKLALDFLDSIISESMDLEEEEEEDTSPPVAQDSNWSMTSESFMKVEMRRRNLDKPVPGVMQEVAPSGKRDSFYKSNANVSANGGITVLRTSMYLPDANYMNPHSSAAKANARNSQVISNYRVESPPPRVPPEVKPRNRSRDSFQKERMLSNGGSNTSTDTGIFSGNSSMNSVGSGQDSNAKPRGAGVQNLVRIYNEQTKPSKNEQPSKRWSANLEDMGRARNGQDSIEQLSKRRSVNLDNLGRGHNELSRGMNMDQASKRRSVNLDSMGRPNGQQNQPKPLPHESAILEEIRAELQYQMCK